MKKKLLVCISLMCCIMCCAQNYRTLTYSNKTGGLCLYNDVKKSTLPVFDKVDSLIQKGPAFIKNNIAKAEITVDTFNGSGTIRIEGYIPTQNQQGNLCEYDIIYEFVVDRDGKPDAIIPSFEVMFTMEHENDPDETYYEYNCGKYFNSRYDSDDFIKTGKIECTNKKFFSKTILQKDFETTLISWIKNVSGKKSLRVLENLDGVGLEL